MAAIALQHREEIITQLASGRLLRDISADLDVSPAAISQHLSKDKEYIAARESGIEQQLETWQHEIAHASNVLNLARGREGFRAAAWRAEREWPHRWGAKQEIHHTGAATMLAVTVTVVATPQSAVEHRVIEAE